MFYKLDLFLSSGGRVRFSEGSFVWWMYLSLLFTIIFTVQQKLMQMSAFSGQLLCVVFYRRCCWQPAAVPVWHPLKPVWAVVPVEILLCISVLSDVHVYLAGWVPYQYFTDTAPVVYHQPYSCLYIFHIYIVFGVLNNSKSNIYCNIHVFCPCISLGLQLVFPDLNHRVPKCIPAPVPNWLNILLLLVH